MTKSRELPDGVTKGFHSRERIEEIAKFWNLGNSAAQVAEKFAISRNAVIGLAHRNRALFETRGRGTSTLKSSKVAQTIAPAAKPTARIQALSRFNSIPLEKKHQSCEHDLAQEQGSASVFDPAYTVRFVEHRSSQCIFIVDQVGKLGPHSMCCGYPVDPGTGVYCKWHRRVAYRSKAVA